MPRTFPQELIDLVIDEASTSAPTLQSCALVSRAFYPRAQYQLFSQIDFVLVPSTRSHGLERLHDVLSNSPHLIQYIRSLKITHGDDKEPLPEDVLVDLEATLVPILASLVNLRSFTVTELDWSCLPPGVRNAIWEVCQRPKLTRLRLKGTGELSLSELVQVTASPALTRLDLDLDVAARAAAEDAVPSSASHLTHLTLSSPHFDGLTSIYPWIVRGRQESCLRQLCVWWHCETTARLQTLVASSVRLRKLILFTTSEFFDAVIRQHRATRLSLAGAAYLQHICLCLDFNFSSPDAAPFVPWLADLLHSHGSTHTPSALHKISLLIGPTITGARPISDGPTAAEWSVLAQVLTPRRFPYLREVTFFWAHGAEDEKHPGLAEAFYAAACAGLPRLDAAGILKWGSKGDGRW
ncbi:hypothetical protein B0H15DRAFT_866765 [Mycena belliarum]|uniref:Uncharacterized protein n=1 Tax=Mycena belliarum TaxID=1033014 RepID=A0AAD6TRT2_9AGAR|nr:hypothetical protein B0H15DRAFT_866765 [Mycena belliae]